MPKLEILSRLPSGPARPVPLLFVHGAFCGAWIWDEKFLGWFADRGWAAHAVSLRGHGGSDGHDGLPWHGLGDYVNDVFDACGQLGTMPVLIGHSMGGMVSLLYAATHPGRVAQLVIVDTTMRMSEDRLAAMREVGNRPGRDYGTLDEFVTRFRLRPPGSVPDQRILQHVAKNSARQAESGGWRHKFDRNVYAQRPELDGIPYWSGIRIPALLVKGARSERISPQVVSQVRARCPQVELVEIAGSDHHVTLDNPSGFVSAVQDFLSRHRKSVE
jgi:pimeloyl-ACP methyl ester carboxylesterase